jgi:glycosyltransferase involved in cell wall biosynthesis
LKELEKLRGDPDVILHLNYMRDYLCNSVLDRKMGFPTLLEFHGEISLPFSEFWKITWDLRWKPVLLHESAKLGERLRQAHLIVCKNAGKADSLRRVFSGQVRQITMGIDFDYWKKREKNAARDRLQLPQDAFIFLSVSRLVNLKQIDRFIQILNRVKSVGQVVFVIIGDGESSYVELLKRLATDAPRNVTHSFPGYVRGSTLLDYYSAADMFVTVSLSEGASVACMEAMACELPILSSDVGGTAEVIRANGKNIVVGRRDYSRWKAIVEGILEGKAVVEHLSRDVAFREYHWPYVAERFLAAYAETLKLARQRV